MSSEAFSQERLGQLDHAYLHPVLQEGCQIKRLSKPGLKRQARVVSALSPTRRRKYKKYSPEQEIFLGNPDRTVHDGAPRIGARSLIMKERKT